MWAQHAEEAGTAEVVQLRHWLDGAQGELQSTQGELRECEAELRAALTQIQALEVCLCQDVALCLERCLASSMPSC